MLTEFTVYEGVFIWEWMWYSLNEKYNIESWRSVDLWSFFLVLCTNNHTNLDNPSINHVQENKKSLFFLSLHGKV